MDYWNIKVKRILKSELVRRGISNAELAEMLSKIGIEETKASIDSKISRGTFSACFLFQALSVIGCNKIEIESFDNDLLLVAEQQTTYKTNQNEN